MFQTPQAPGFAMRQTLKANKLAMDTSYRWLCMIQDHIGKSTDIAWRQMTLGQESAEKAQVKWFALVKKERESAKKMFDSVFEAYESFSATGNQAKNSEKAREDQAEKAPPKKEAGKK